MENVSIIVCSRIESVGLYDMYHIVVGCIVLFCFFFFFQAEDGIRDTSVTGVQTCALPILNFSSPI